VDEKFYKNPKIYGRVDNMLQIILELGGTFGSAKGGMIPIS